MSGMLELLSPSCEKGVMGLADKGARRTLLVPNRTVTLALSLQNIFAEGHCPRRQISHRIDPFTAKSGLQS